MEQTMKPMALLSKPSAKNWHTGLLPRLLLYGALAGLAIGPGSALAQRPAGIDVSDNNGGGLNWGSIHGAGVSYAWAKATEGATVNDSQFVANVSNGKGAGVLMGAYHFARPNLNSPGTEANHFWSIAHPYI